MRKLVLFSLLSLMGCQPENPFKGTWKIHRIEQQIKDKWEIAEWMKGGIGYLHYGDSEMSLIFTPANYPETRTGDYWYLARYHYSSDTVYHHRISHSDPEEIGLTGKRLFRFVEDTLILVAPEHRLRLKWIRYE